MPFGLCNVSAALERLLELVLQGLTWKVCLVYLEYVIVMERHFDEHLSNVKEVFTRLRKFHVLLNHKKCVVSNSKSVLIGHVIAGIQISRRSEQLKSGNVLKMNMKLGQQIQFF